MDILNNLTNDVLAKSMEGHLARQKAITGNVANAETPYYRRQDVHFEAALDKATQKIRSANEAPPFPVASNNAELPMTAINTDHFGWEEFQSLSGIQPQGYEDPEDVMWRNDGNNIDLEKEMVSLARNTGKFKSLVSLQGRLNQETKQVINSSSS